MNRFQPVTILGTVIALTVLSFACSAPTAPAPTSREADTKKPTTTNTDENDPSTTPPPAPAPSSAAAPTTPPPATTQTTDPNDAQEKSCLTSCFGTNTAAAQLETQTDACYSACGDSDGACLTRCDSQFDQLCAGANAATCDVVDQCETKCFPDDQASQAK